MWCSAKKTGAGGQCRDMEEDWTEKTTDVNKILPENYRIIRRLGVGAFAEVFLAENETGGQVACKVSRQVGLLEKEAKMQAQLHHPLFATFFAFRREGETACIFMEAIEGESLKESVEKRGYLTEKRTAQIGARIAEGLFFLHQRQPSIIFRDVKPENVIIDRNGHARLLDFGCACVAGRNPAPAGSPGFGAPEQFVQEKLQTTAADVYGLGKTLTAVIQGKGHAAMRQLLRECTRECAEDRLADMGELACMLHVLAEDGGRGLSGRQRAVLQGKLKVIKNICL